MQNLNVSFNDLGLHHSIIKEELNLAISNVIENSSFIRGPEIEIFEERFAALLGSRYCVSCANGTDAIYLALRALKVKPGDEVIVPAHSWISTSSAVTQAGGQVVFCDTGEDDTIDINKIQDKITNKTVGIIPVHLFGQPAKIDHIVNIANKHNLWVVEDCAQAHLAKYKNQTVGTFGQLGTFSFYPGKNLGAMGDAGAVISNDQSLVERVARLARHGGLIKGEHIIEGVNSRMDGVQAAVLLVKLKYIEQWTDLRRKVAADYKKSINETSKLKTPNPLQYTDPAWHLYVIKSKKRDKLRDHLTRHKIQTVINYPTALPFLPAYAHLQHTPNDFPNAFQSQNESLSIPIYPELNAQQIDHVTQCINNF